VDLDPPVTQCKVVRISNPRCLTTGDYFGSELLLGGLVYHGVLRGIYDLDRLKILSVCDMLRDLGGLCCGSL
jgi:hypothetical protein